MNIYEKLSLITTELGAVAKNLNVGTGKSSYKAVGEADVLAAVKPLEAKYKVYSYPVSRKIIESGTIENESTDYNGNKTIKKQLFERIEVCYRFVNIEKPEEYIDIVSYGDGIDSQDKSVGKAMTYADKYALLKAYKIITGDDPDQNASGELKSVKTELDQALVDRLANEFNCDLQKASHYIKKIVPQITNIDLSQLIAKFDAIKKQREQNTNGNNIQ